MEWVETTGRTVADAIEAALDELGVHEEDVEHEVLVEPKAGLFGRIGSTEARVRVRLKPISREKPGDRRRRRGKGGGRGGGNGSGGGEGRGGSRERTRSGGGRGGRGSGSGGGRGPGGGRSRGGESRAGSEVEGSGASRGGRGDRAEEATGGEMDEATVPVERQAESAVEFTTGLVEAFGADAAVGHEIEDDTITVRIDGTELGLLIGPRGATLHAVEELVRAVVQRETGGHGARIHVDVAGYRAKRRAALEEFTREVARRVLESGEETALESMNAPDRKVVHDTVAEMDGLETTSEGEEPRRYVVIRPA
jgi:spoIIIJ-associated protein